MSQERSKKKVTNLIFHMTYMYVCSLLPDMCVSCMCVCEGVKHPYLSLHIKWLAPFPCMCHCQHKLIVAKVIVTALIVLYEYRNPACVCPCMVVLQRLMNICLLAFKCAGLVDH